MDPKKPVQTPVNLNSPNDTETPVTDNPVPNFGHVTGSPSEFAPSSVKQTPFNQSVSEPKPLPDFMNINTDPLMDAKPITSSPLPIPTPPVATTVATIAAQPSPLPQTQPTKEPQNPTIQTVTTNASDDSQPKKSRSKLKLLFLFLFLFLFLLLISSSVLAYTIAYEKIPLKNYPKIQAAVSGFVMSLPLTPKTPKFLIAKAVINQEKVKSNSFDLSLAAKTSEKSDLLNLNELDLQMKGVIDYQDPKNIRTSFNAAWGKNLNFDFTKTDETAYFKINTIPKTMITLLGLNADKLDPMLHTWVSYDTSKLETEAGKYLEEKTQADNTATQASTIDTYNNLFDEKIAKSIKVSNDKDDNFPVYKLVLEADNDMVDYLNEKLQSQNKPSGDLYLQNNSLNKVKLSDSLKNLKIELHIDKSKYLLRSFIVAFDITPNQKLSDLGKSKVLGTSTTPLSFLESKISIAIVAKFGNFGEAVDINKPADSITFDDYAKKFNEILPELMPRPTQPAQTTPTAPANINIPSEFENSITPTSSKFQSDGIQTIDDGASVWVTSAQNTGKTIKAHVIFSNTTTTVKKVAPLRTSMQGGGLGYYPEPALLSLDIPAGSSKSYDFTYTYEGTPSELIWYYSNTDSTQTELAKMSL